MKKFDIPDRYKSSIISKIKEVRRAQDKAKKDFKPSVLDLGPVRFLIARHFGFCYGVENAIEIIYKIIAQNPDKNIYLLSEMIHNPLVNEDLLDQGVRFILSTKGEQIISWDTISSDDIVVIPAFGTTVEIEGILKHKNIETHEYNTTCPFVEKVWKKSAKLSEDDCTIVVHGKHTHEETRATFSHSKEFGQTIVTQNLAETKILSAYMLGRISREEFDKVFATRASEGFDPDIHLHKVGVVNQTTMLATDTQEIADHLKQTMVQKYGEENVQEHFADTRDTLCYATSDNQNAVYGLLKEDSDLAIVVGGYNSSNTSHLVELCEVKLPTYHISSSDKILSKNSISHYKFRTSEELITKDYLPEDKDKVTIAITSGASCPDATVDEVIEKVASFFTSEDKIKYALESFENTI